MSAVAKFGKCEGCGSEDASLKCGNCKFAFYCSQVCQKQMWKDHKKVCCNERQPIELCLMPESANGMPKWGVVALKDIRNNKSIRCLTPSQREHTADDVSLIIFHEDGKQPNSGQLYRPNAGLYINEDWWVNVLQRNTLTKTSWAEFVDSSVPVIGFSAAAQLGLVRREHKYVQEFFRNCTKMSM